MSGDENHDHGGSTFEELSSEPTGNLLREFLDFLKHRKKLWMAPIIALLLLIGLFVILAGSGAAPFIYALF